MSKNPFDELIDNFEGSFKSFISHCYSDLIENKTSHENAKKTTAVQLEGNKIALEQHLNNICEQGRNLELMVLKTRLDFCRRAPELLLHEEIQCLKAELSRKEELLTTTKEKIALWEQALKQFHQNIDTQFRTRLETCTNVLIPPPQQSSLIDHSNMNPASVASQHMANQSFEQPQSADNSIIIIDSNKPY